MNRSPDVDLVLRDYFADDGFIAPDHVLEVVEERIMRQPQQRAWRVLRRDAHVNSYLKPLLAVAAVVVIAVAGIALLGQPSDSGVGDATSPAPSPSPIASTSPSTAPSAGAMLPPWYPNPDSSGAGILAAGSHTTKSFNPAFSFSVPEGWVNDYDDVGFYSLFPDTPANETEFALSGSLAHSIYGGPRNDPWFICEPFGQGLGDTSAEIVASLMANEALVTEQADVTIGGLTGKQVDVRLDPDWTGSCPANSEDPTLDFLDIRERGLLLDSPDRGHIVIFFGSRHSADHEAFLAEAMPIVESFEFDLSN
jgi:hypothetical protein